MGKKRSSKKRRGGGGGGESTSDACCWSSNDFLVRKEQRRKRRRWKSNKAAAAATSSSSFSAAEKKEEERLRRSALLTRDSKEKREEGKLRLHIQRTKRQLERLRERLEQWDDVAEKELATAAKKKKEEEEIRKKKEEEEEQQQQPKKKKKKKGRLGPETWKLKGAARPAYQVYDFDTRYVDPHVKAHEEAHRKARRIRNVFAVCGGRFGLLVDDDDDDVDKNNSNSDAPPQPQCREYLSLLMRLGLLSMRSKQYYKLARSSFKECMDLEGSSSSSSLSKSQTPPVTSARCHLMKLYLEQNRPDSARRLWESLPSTDHSVWIRYSAALLEFVSHNILNEKNGSSQSKCDETLMAAVKANVFCAYYIAFFDTFQKVMERTDDIEEDDDIINENENGYSPLLEAIEYCNHEQGIGAWLGTDGAIEWIKQFIIVQQQRRHTIENDGGGGNINADDESIVNDGAAVFDWKEALSTVRRSSSTTQKNSSSVDKQQQPQQQQQEENGGYDDSDDDTDPNDDNNSMDVVDIDMYATMFETSMEMVEASGQLKHS